MDGRPGLESEDGILRACGTDVGIRELKEDEIVSKNAEGLKRNKIRLSRLEEFKKRFEDYFKGVNEYVKDEDVNMSELLLFIADKNERLEDYKLMYMRIYPEEIDFHKKNQQCYIDLPEVVIDGMDQAMLRLSDLKNKLTQYEHEYAVLMQEVCAMSDKMFVEMEEQRRPILKEEIESLRSAILVIESEIKIINTEHEMRILESNGELTE